MSIFIHYINNASEHTVEISTGYFRKNPALFVIKPGGSLPNAFNISESLIIQCNGCNCLCAEFARLFRQYYKTLEFRYTIDCCFHYRNIPHSRIVFRDVDILNSEVKLQFHTVHIESCNFDPNFLIATNSIVGLTFSECNLKYLLWCYTNLRLGKMPVVSRIGWKSQWFQRNLALVNAVPIDKQISDYLDKYLTRNKKYS